MRQSWLGGSGSTGCRVRLRFQSSELMTVSGKAGLDSGCSGSRIAELRVGGCVWHLLAQHLLPCGDDIEAQRPMRVPRRKAASVHERQPQPHAPKLCGGYGAFFGHSAQLDKGKKIRQTHGWLSKLWSLFGSLL